MYFLHKKKLKTLCNVPIDEHYTMCYTIITARATARTLNKRIKGDNEMLSVKEMEMKIAKLQE